jgi:SAM-dependent methyltransferase
VAHCSTCDTAFVTGPADPGPVYERIYAQVERVPGYARYARHAREALRARDPLGYLAGAEDVYWAVARHLAERERAGGARPRVLEVGSGMGYLTYALARRGYPVLGVDLSRAAVERARAAYGDLYQCGDVSGLAGGDARYDLAVMNELIEHVRDPAAVLRAVAGVLAPGGEILVTTPDKGYHPPGSLWDTELPPVHLWWFSEPSLRFLARGLGWGVRLLDFAEYNRSRYAVPPGSAPRAPVLDAAGRVRGGGRAAGVAARLVEVTRRAGVVRGVRALQARLATAAAGAHRRRPTLCAIFTPGAG